MHPFTRKNLFIAACYAGTLALGMFFGPKFSRENSNGRNGAFLPFGNSRSTKIEQVLQLITDKYVDSVKTDTLQHFAIHQILSRLDPYSHYLLPSEAQYLNEDLEGHFDGIGIEYFLINDTLLVTHVIPQSPAEKSGLHAGDKILHINDKNVAGTAVSSSDVSGLLRGKRGTLVQLLIKPADGPVRKMQVKRSQIAVSSIDVAYMLDSVNGYIKISRFGAATDTDFSTALTQLKKKGMKQLVLDLRENGGGYLNAAVALADQFLSDKQLIVYTQGLHEARRKYFATAEGVFEKGKLVILVDEKTASASEIVAGAIQDLNRGIIIGSKTFGKGLVQEQFNFGDGSALNLTVARYYTPSGRSIQRPYKKPGFSTYYHSWEEPKKSAAESRLNDSLYGKNTTYTTTGGKLIYGGGGITPDIAVSADTSSYNDFYYQVIDKGLLQNFLFNELVKQKEKPSRDAFLHHFKISDKEYGDFASLALKNQVQANAQEIKIARPVIEQELKALLGRYYYGDEFFFRALNASDKAITRSLEALQ